ncbi:BatD family protein [Piscinibacter gummiphilus]|uniref:Uncharacterized protein n=1 Tax=Piscinibacter gummiphilus TaxID=946333 RepID=A0A1W6LH03_9BURK|nr:BatD family protein [Piscinibacter gummiphilus]ARN23498.1 hypothetical protein A4W93_28375 [Piscinibacter gummiphilus]ATU68205.1 hypothetical protein CPZ87_28510 [Piscinibacter gummiphilus]GLS97526.1 hypothetical protein GCM10007918_48180 [Piscinibacter gummiphilus]
MTRWGLVLLLLLQGAAWAASPRVTVRLQEKQPVLVGQQVHVHVKVMTPNYFTSAPPFPPLAVSGAIVTMPDESGQNATETIGGVTYASIEKTYVFAAQQAGDFTLPPARITFTYGGDDGKPQHGTVALPPFKIIAKLPPGAAAAASAAGGALMPVARVTIRQQFDRPDGTPLHVGDALVRTLDTSAAQTQAMMIPPPHAEAPAGVRVFAADPVLGDDSGPRGEFLGGHRTDRITYVFEKPGTYTLPAVRIGWFDAQANRSRTAEAPERVVTVQAGVAAGNAIAPEAASAPAAAVVKPPRRWRVADVVEAAVIGLVVLGAVSWGWRRLARHLPAWRERRAARRAAHAASEAVAFAAVAQALRAGKALQADAALLHWSRHLGGTVSSWAVAQGDTELSTALAALRLALYARAGDGAEAASRALLGPLQRARERWVKTRDARSVAALVPLNP